MTKYYPSKEAVAKNLEAFIKYKKLNGLKVSEITGLTPAQISRMRNATQEVQTNTIDLVAEKLGGWDPTLLMSQTDGWANILQKEANPNAKNETTGDSAYFRIAELITIRNDYEVSFDPSETQIFAQQELKSACPNAFFVKPQKEFENWRWPNGSYLLIDPDCFSYPGESIALIYSKRFNGRSGFFVVGYKEEKNGTINIRDLNQEYIKYYDKDTTDVKLIGTVVSSVVIGPTQY